MHWLGWVVEVGGWGVWLPCLVRVRGWGGWLGFVVRVRGCGAWLGCVVRVRLGGRTTFLCFPGMTAGEARCSGKPLFLSRAPAHSKAAWG